MAQPVIDPLDARCVLGGGRGLAGLWVIISDRFRESFGVILSWAHIGK